MLYSEKSLIFVLCLNFKILTHLTLSVIYILEGMDALASLKELVVIRLRIKVVIIYYWSHTHKRVGRKEETFEKAAFFFSLTILNACNNP